MFRPHFSNGLDFHHHPLPRVDKLASLIVSVYNSCTNFLKFPSYGNCSFYSFLKSCHPERTLAEYLLVHGKFMCKDMLHLSWRCFQNDNSGIRGQKNPSPCSFNIPHTILFQLNHLLSPAAFGNPGISIFCNHVTRNSLSLSKQTPILTLSWRCCFRAFPE